MEKVRVIICPEKTQGIIHPNIFSHTLVRQPNGTELAEGKYISRWIALMPM